MKCKSMRPAISTKLLNIILILACMFGAGLSKATIKCSRLLVERRFVILNDSQVYGGVRVEKLIHIDGVTYFNLGLVNSSKVYLENYLGLEFVLRYPHLAKTFGMELHPKYGFIFLPPTELNTKLDLSSNKKISNSLRYEDAFFGEIPKSIYADYLVRRVVPLATHSRLFYHDRIANHQVANFLMPEVLLDAFVTRLEAMYKIRDHFENKKDFVRKNKAQQAIDSMVDIWDTATAGFGFRIMAEASPFRANIRATVNEAMHFLRQEFYEFKDPLTELVNNLRLPEESQTEWISEIESGVSTPNRDELVQAENRIYSLLLFGRSGHLKIY